MSFLEISPTLRSSLHQKTLKPHQDGPSLGNKILIEGVANKNDPFNFEIATNQAEIWPGYTCHHSTFFSYFQWQNLCLLHCRSIIDRALNLLEPKSGVYMTHCNGKSVPSTLKSYEDMIKSLRDGNVGFKKRESFVSSFMEIWVFYELFFKQCR